jgi:hypothetical protein
MPIEHVSRLYDPARFNVAVYVKSLKFTGVAVSKLRQMKIINLLHSSYIGLEKETTELPSYFPNIFFRVSFMLFRLRLGLAVPESGPFNW